ncbi:hypothetical protein ES288_A09G109200v1 [Gossypium darwinii]|uniref:Uncharacterized protein n=1 Tax=Gossypium darwinii TaxID=34276 RepID=A0A5D2F7R4_GOSDA|nr:hypothetical protein ES288_A09G109200v1 [Gossypium darwinii]
MMEQVPGALGTSASLALRLGQTIFSSASLLFMCLDVEFYNYTSFSGSLWENCHDHHLDESSTMLGVKNFYERTDQNFFAFPFLLRKKDKCSQMSCMQFFYNGGSDDKLNFDGPMDFNKDLCRSSSFNGTMVGEENAVSMLVPSYSQEQLPEIFVGLKSQQGCIGEMSDVEDETFNTVVSRSSQTCRIDLLEEIIEDAKDNKVLFALNLLLSFVNFGGCLDHAIDYELDERRSCKGGMDILVKVEELKQMLPHAKEVNDMVVYLLIT